MSIPFVASLSLGANAFAPSTSGIARAPTALRVAEIPVTDEEEEIPVIDEAVPVSSRSTAAPALFSSLTTHRLNCVFAFSTYLATHRGRSRSRRWAETERRSGLRPSTANASASPITHASACV